MIRNGLVSGGNRIGKRSKNNSDLPSWQLSSPVPCLRPCLRKHSEITPCTLPLPPTTAFTLLIAQVIARGLDSVFLCSWARWQMYGEHASPSFIPNQNVSLSESFDVRGLPPWITGHPSSALPLLREPHKGSIIPSCSTDSVEPHVRKYLNLKNKTFTNSAEHLW